MTMRKKTTAISQRIKKQNRSKLISQTWLKEAGNKGLTGLDGQQPGGPSRPLSRRGAVSRPPGPWHPSRRSARGNPSPSARQRGRQPTNPGRPPRISTGSAAPPLDARFTPIICFQYVFLVLSLTLPPHASHSLTQCS